MYPAGVEVDSEAWVPGRKTANFPDGVIPPRRFVFFERIAKEESLPYLSLLEVFKNDREPKRLFYPYDGHWTKEGHKLAARAVAKEFFSMIK